MRWDCIGCIGQRKLTSQYSSEYWVEMLEKGYRQDTRCTKSNWNIVFVVKKDNKTQLLRLTEPTLKNKISQLMFLNHF